MRAPILSKDDVLALSFVRGLPRADLFALLRGDELPDTPTLPLDRTWGAGEAPHGDAALEALLARLSHRRDSRDVARDARRNAECARRKAVEKGIRVIVWGEAAYPPLLTHLFDPPLALWVRGSVDALTGVLVAVVGSRAASPYGETAAARLSSDLASRGFTIVSGLARGIDAAAHRGALGVAGRTVAVLGSGADVVYPPEHRALLDEVTIRGAVVSEYPPGTRPHKGNFPRRNRIISGLSVGVIVVEASAHSGALITADCALEQGRQVMAVPGNVLSERHRGSHTLLKSGAALVESIDDVLDALNLDRGAGAATAVLAPADPVMALVETGEGCDLDTLSARLGCDATVLLPRLLELELQGLIRRLPGGRFVRSVRTC